MELKGKNGEYAEYILRKIYEHGDWISCYELLKDLHDKYGYTLEPEVVLHDLLDGHHYLIKDGEYFITTCMGDKAIRDMIRNKERKDSIIDKVITIIQHTMKKNFMLLVTVLMCLGMSAQSVGYKGVIDEYEIQGGWKVDEQKGEISGVGSALEYFSLSGNSITTLWGIKDDKVYLSYFFISNGNKMHWVLTNGINVSFIIMDYDKTNMTMTLKTMDDQCTMKVHRWQTPFSVNTAKVAPKDAKRYNLQGIQDDNAKGIVIEDGKKILVK